MHLFYCTDITDNHATLSPEESAHCIRVLRMKKGEKVNVIDGRGNLIEAIIEDPAPSKCRVAITSITKMPHPRKSKLHIAIAPTKSIDRFEWFVEKAVEIGIDEITPLLCGRSERRSLKTERLEKLVIATIKQAQVYSKPLINELTDYSEFLAHLEKNYQGRYIAHCGNTEKRSLSESVNPANDNLILIGPEGDFTTEEIRRAITTGFISISLGPTRLRTETAGVVACTTLNSAITEY